MNYVEKSFISDIINKRFSIHITCSLKASYDGVAYRQNDKVLQLQIRQTTMFRKNQTVCTEKNRHKFSALELQENNK
jgi:hypothetical protein